jgi:hypothetical protein
MATKLVRVLRHCYAESISGGPLDRVTGLNEPVDVFVETDAG